MGFERKSALKDLWKHQNSKQLPLICKKARMLSQGGFVFFWTTDHSLNRKQVCQMSSDVVNIQLMSPVPCTWPHFLKSSLHCSAGFWLLIEEQEFLLCSLLQQNFQRPGLNLLKTLKQTHCFKSISFFQGCVECQRATGLGKYIVNCKSRHAMCIADDSWRHSHDHKWV